MATFGREGTQLNIPFVFLPLKGQIIYPSKEIVFTGMALKNNVLNDNLFPCNYKNNIVL